MYATQRGFVALIMVLVMTVTITTWVGLSSGHIFDFMRAEKRFVESRQYGTDFLICVDTAIDHEVRLQFINTLQQYAIRPYGHTAIPTVCQVSDRSVVEVSPQEHLLHFRVRILDHVGFIDVTVSRVRGFVTAIKTRLYTP